MMPSPNRLPAELVELTRAGLSLAELFAAASRLLEPLVGFDAYCWETLDPATLLPTSGVTQNLPRESAPAFFENEYGCEDFNKFDQMFSAGVNARSLFDATDGQPERSRRYRELLVPNGFGPELRALLADAGECWGAVAFIRTRGKPEFTAMTTAFVARAAGQLGWAVRTALLLSAPVPQTQRGPGVIVVDRDGRIVSTTPTAERWLALLDESHHLGGDSRLPVALEGVLARLAEPTEEPPRARIRGLDGSWLVVHAAPLRGTDQRAIVIEPVAPRELASVIVRAYALSPRERQVAELVLRGMSTKEIGQLLELSTHTVADYLKTLFEKVGVHSRGELAARFFFDHHMPRLFGGASVGPDGWFSDS
jgi:DNA-binding CsgD family transcriptional regulator